MESKLLKAAGNKVRREAGNANGGRKKKMVREKKRGGVLQVTIKEKGRKSLPRSAGQKRPNEERNTECYAGS